MDVLFKWMIPLTGLIWFHWVKISLFSILNSTAAFNSQFRANYIMNQMKENFVDCCLNFMISQNSKIVKWNLNPSDVFHVYSMQLYSKPCLIDTCVIRFIVMSDVIFHSLLTIPTFYALCNPLCDTKFHSRCMSN